MCCGLVQANRRNSCWNLRWYVDLASTFSVIAEVKPLTDLSNAWHWPVTPGWDRAMALSQDRKHLFQCFALDCYDEDLARAILLFAREHDADLIAPPERPLVVVEGFSHPEYRFDMIVAISPTIHKYYKENPELHCVTRAAFPAYRCEFAGDETEKDAWYRYTVASGVQPTRWKREPRPYLKMRYRAETGRVSQWGFFQRGDLVHQLRTLKDRTDRFVEFENYRHQIWRVEWDGGWVLIGQSSTDRRLLIDELLKFVSAGLYGPNLNAMTSWVV
jgi:hypothetical protein